jgi:hypothetical protein
VPPALGVEAAPKALHEARDAPKCLKRARKAAARFAKSLPEREKLRSLFPGS